MTQKWIFVKILPFHGQEQTVQKRTTSLSYQITTVLFRWRTQTLLKGIWIPLSHSVCMALQKGTAICDKNKLEILIHYCSTMNSACFWKETDDMFTFLWHNQWATSKGWKKKMFTKNLTEPTLLSKCTDNSVPLEFVIVTIFSKESSEILN